MRNIEIKRDLGLPMTWDNLPKKGLPVAKRIAVMAVTAFKLCALPKEEAADVEMVIEVPLSKLKRKVAIRIDTITNKFIILNLSAILIHLTA